MTLDIVIEKPLMGEMIVTLFRNSDKPIVKALKKTVKKQLNPFKTHFGEYVTDRQTFLFLQNLYMTYLTQDEEVRKGITLRVIKDE